MSLSGRIRTSVVTALVTGAAALFATGCGLLGTASPAAASSSQLAMFEVPNGLTGSNANPMGVLQTLRSLGVDILRVPVVWNCVVSPTCSSTTRPAGNPYTNWGAYDTIVNDARSLGIAVDLMPTGGAPLWATGPGSPPPCMTEFVNQTVCFQTTWKPSASDYGAFVKAAAEHFGGRVHFWEIWNEANWGPSLTPQYLHSSVPVSANLYRGLLDAAYSALRSTGHGHDTISIGNLSQDSSAQVGETGTSAPLIFVRTLYCVNGSYHQLKGGAARQAGCSGSKSRFRHAHPALFSVSGLGIHPYPFAGKRPTQLDFPSPNGAEFAEIPQVLKTLDRLQRTFGSHKRMKVFNTEYAYRTRPNDAQSFFTSPARAAVFMNQAEYISWKNPRIGTYDQYELEDAGWFPTGLFFAPNTSACPGAAACPKPSFAAYRLPVWLPVTSAKRGRSLEVWGDVRPARYARKPQSVQVQFASGGSSSYSTVKTVRISNLYGYFDVRVKFPGSGSVRLAWTYPPGLTDPIDPSQQIYSRVTSIRLH